MSRTSNPNDLTARLRSRLATERRQFEETAASEQRRLGENLRAVANGALRTIEGDTAVTVARIRRDSVGWPGVSGCGTGLTPRKPLYPNCSRK